MYSAKTFYNVHIFLFKGTEKSTQYCYGSAPHMTFGRVRISTIHILIANSVSQKKKLFLY
jgi:hypothetical protein